MKEDKESNTVIKIKLAGRREVKQDKTRLASLPFGEKNRVRDCQEV